MKKLYILFIAFFSSVSTFGQLSINEIYMGDGLTNVNQFIEISGPANYSLIGWQLEFYSVLGDFVSSIALTDQYTNMGPEIQDGKSLISIVSSNLSIIGGGIALISPTNEVAQFFNISLIGTGTLIPDPLGPGIAAGSESINIGSITLDSTSKQLTDSGWIAATPNEGVINIDQTLTITKNQIAGFAMYPNPVTNGEFSISSSSGSQKNIEIFSINGNRVYKNSVKTRENIDISNLTPGIYMVRVEEEGILVIRKLAVN